MSSLKQPDLSIVIPAYHEEKRIGKTLVTLARFLRTNSYFKHKSVEVIVVAADAPDKTVQIVQAKSTLFKDFRLVQPGIKAGKGRDVQFGIVQARGKIKMFMDADLATPLSHIEEFYQRCIADSDLVIGTRNLFDHHPTFGRRVISNAGNFLFRLSCGLWLEDSQCGFKMFRASAADVCFNHLRIMGWGFDMEILAVARSNGFEITTVRLNDWHDMPDSTFTDNVALVSLRSVRDLGWILSRRLLGSYRKP
jgi:dolichyl-phosphate beta-glucosyltransferase